MHRGRTGSNWNRLIIILMVFINGMVPVVCAQSSEKDNAAVWYQQAIELENQVSMKDWDTLSGISWDHPVTPQEQAALARVRPILDLMRKGSQKQYSDFHLNREDGIEMNLRHLAPIRSIAKVAHADIIAQMQQGNTQAAADRMASVIRMTGHLRDDKTVISSLVGEALFRYVNDDIQAGFDRGILSPSESVRIDRAMSVLPSNDPFGIVEGVAAESDTFGSWLDRMYHDPEQREKMGAYFDDAEDTNAVMANLRDMPEESFQKELQQYNSANDRIVEAFQQDDPAVAKQMLATLRADLENDPFGQMALLLVPSYEHIYDQMKKIETSLNTRKEMLKALIGDKVSITELMNAAAVYENAAQHYDEIDPSWKKTIDLMMTGANPDDATLELLKNKEESTTQVLSLVEQAVNIKRCDFTSFRRWHSFAFLPSYLLHMKRLATLLELDARLHFYVDDDVNNEIALREIGAMFRMTAHLAGDDTIVAPLLSHEIFKRAVTLLNDETGDQNQSEDTNHAVADKDIPAKYQRLLLSIESYQELMRSVSQISRADPFGYINSIIKVRPRAAEVLRGYLSRDTIGESVRKAYSGATVAGLDGDSLLALASVLDAHHEKGWKPPHEPKMQDILDAYQSKDLSSLYEDANRVMDSFLDHYNKKATQLWLIEKQHITKSNNATKTQNNKSETPHTPKIDKADTDSITALIPVIHIYEQGRKTGRTDLRALDHLLETLAPKPEIPDQSVDGAVAGEKVKQTESKDGP